MGALLSVEGMVLGGYVMCLVILLLFSLAQLHLAVILRRHRQHRQHRRPDDPLRGATSAAVPAAVTVAATAAGGLPHVTVQLPIYNERYVVERLLHAVAAIDYPRDRLEIQVLDDSTDITKQIVAGLVERLAATGLTVTHLHRADRTGFKAGALADGLARARGEFVAIFDADFLPAPDFLAVTIPHFADPAVAAVQARWGYLNEPDSALTRVQGFLLDLHFRLEQPARSAAGLFLNFNGTAGVWRRAAIDSAGGWSARTLTEDIDLSYRAQLAGWRLVYLDDYPCPAELPAEMSGVRSQQYRWLKGGAQNARLHLARIARSDLPLRLRHHACQHLLAGSMYLVILAAVLLSVPLAAVKNTAIDTDYADYGVPFVLSTLALVAAFHAAHRPRGVAGTVRFGAQMLRFMVFTMGLAVHNGSAVLSGWVGGRGEFVRTPKFGPAGWTGSAYTRRTVDRRIAGELAVLAVLAAGLAIGWHRGEFALVPLQLMAMTGLVWVVTLSLWHPVRARWSAPPEGAPRPAGGAPRHGAGAVAGADILEEAQQ